MQAFSSAPVSGRWHKWLWTTVIRNWALQHWSVNKLAACRWDGADRPQTSSRLPDVGEHDSRRGAAYHVDVCTTSPPQPRLSTTINLPTVVDWLPTVAKKADTVGWQSGKHGLRGQRSTGPTVGGCWRWVIDSCYNGEYAPAGNVQSLAVSIKLQHTDQYRDVARDKYSIW